MTLHDFEQMVFNVAFHSPICDLPQIVRLTATAIKLRVELWISGQIEAFYNEETETTAYAFIRDGQRIFGADNTGRWHFHPFARRLSACR